MDFPTYILTRIIEHVEVKDLHSCALVNRLFHTIANSRLYQSLTIKTTHQLNQLMNGLTSAITYPSLTTFTYHAHLEHNLTNKQLLQLVAHTPHLVSLSVNNSPITLASVRQLTKYCHHLAQLCLNNCRGLTTALFDTLVITCPQLQVLDVDISGMADLHAALHEGGPTVGHVTWAAHHLAYKSAFNVAQLVRLTVLTLHHAPAVLARHILMAREHPMDDAARRHRLPGWPKLTTLSLDSCSGLRDLPTIDFLVVHPQLHTLVLNDGSISNSVLRTIRTRLHHLTYLGLRGTTRITASGLRRLIMTCTSLAYVDVKKSKILASAFPEAGVQCVDQTTRSARTTYLAFLDPSSLMAIRRSGRVMPLTPKQANEKGDANNFDDGKTVTQVYNDRVQAFSQLPAERYLFLLGHGLGRMNRLDRMYGGDDHILFEPIQVAVPR